MKKQVQQIIQKQVSRSWDLELFVFGLGIIAGVIISAASVYVYGFIQCH